MGKGTAIEYCDDTLNLEIGCAGCELWNFKVCIHCGKPIEPIENSEDYRHKGDAERGDGHLAEPIDTCYAGNLVGRYAGHSTGYPEAFDKPKLFLGRLLQAARWKDLRGGKRMCHSCWARPCRCDSGMDKPWLDGLPRFIFLNDLGDTFTEGLPDDWLGLPSGELRGFSPLQVLSQMKAVIMLLTKRATQMRQFFEKYECPQNFICMVSITGPETINRVRELVKVNARWRGVSAEPLLRDTVKELEPFLPQLHWVATGAESASVRGYDLQHFRKMRDVCAQYGTAMFMKQLDKVAEIPPDLQVRQLPAFTLD